MNKKAIFLIICTLAFFGMGHFAMASGYSVTEDFGGNVLYFHGASDVLRVVYRPDSVGSDYWTIANHGGEDPVVSSGLVNYSQNGTYTFWTCLPDNPSGYTYGSPNCSQQMTFVILNNHLVSYEGNDTSTHFIDLYPVGGSTVATTTDIGYQINVNSVDWVEGMQVKMSFTQPSEFACLNSGAVYDAIYGCTGANAPAPTFSTTTYPVTTMEGISTYTTSVTFPKGGKWVGTYELRKSTWWGLFSEIVIASTTPFTIGQPSYMDIVQAQLASTSLAQRANHGKSIYEALASTTEYMKIVCNPLGLSSGFLPMPNPDFDVGSCLAGVIIPPAGGLADDIAILEQLPPWGYAFRVYDIFTATTSTSTALMPQINYSFATGTPLASDFGSIHFDPFGSIVQAGTLINEMKSDRSDSKTVWDIMDPFVTAFVYLALGFMIFHDLTGVHSHADNNQNKT